ncbi:DUF6528 family protein [Rhizobium rhizogenes]
MTKSVIMTLAAAIVAFAAAQPALAADRLYACGDDQIREYRIDGGAATETWRWRATDANDLPEAYRLKFLRHLDDCKPIDGGRSILATASTGGAVLIDRETGHVSFHAKTPMAHSADLLPGGWVAIALSIHAEGDRLEIYGRDRSEAPLLSLPLPSGHGAVWDAARARLFVLSHDLIQAYKVEGTEVTPTLTETARWTLPGRHDGHDLSSRPGGGYFVTTDDGVWTFDPNAGSFSPFSVLNPKLQVKAVSALGDRLAWVQAEESWWANDFTVAGADGSEQKRIPIEGMHLYKVRWIR